MTIEELRSRHGGKTLIQTIMLRSVICETGLPRMNFVLACDSHMVSWNKDTGEVSTIEYEEFYI